MNDTETVGAVREQANVEDSKKIQFEGRLCFVSNQNRVRARDTLGSKKENCA